MFNVVEQSIQLKRGVRGRGQCTYSVLSESITMLDVRLEEHRD